MRKITLILILLLHTFVSLSQVGIGTMSPQKELHIAGSNATIRIESLNSVNNPTYNNGVKLAPAYVDGNGDITIGNGSGPAGNEPLNFLIDVPNFVSDDPYGTGYRTGSVISNNDLGQNLVEGEISMVSITVPQDAILEIKYGITMLISGRDIIANLPFLYYVTYNQAISMLTYLKVDVNSDGLDPSEATKIYGQKAQYYATYNQGIVGYPYMNGQAYLSVPAGTHTLYFYGQVRDASDSYTSVGFGGAQDYLKIRVYN